LRKPEEIFCIYFHVLIKESVQSNRRPINRKEAREMKLFNRHFVRSLEGVNLFEIFFVNAVASVLGIRFFLALTGYRTCPIGWPPHDGRLDNLSELHQ
jgi:hypothetical protein